MANLITVGDVVSIDPTYIKNSLSNRSDLYGKNWIVDLVLSPDNSIDRFLFGRATDGGEDHLEIVNGAPIWDRYLVRNDFLTLVHQASGHRRKYSRG